MSAKNKLLLAMLQKVCAEMQGVYEFAEEFADEGTLEDLDFAESEVKLLLSNLQERFKSSSFAS